jgi:hypothetical protein
MDSRPPKPEPALRNESAGQEVEPYGLSKIMEAPEGIGGGIFVGLGVALCCHSVVFPLCVAI